MTRELDPTKLQQHPLALIVPRPSPEDYRVLRDAIRKRGQIDPIVLYQDKVLEGWTRTSACRELRRPVIAEDEPFKGNEAAARFFVLDKNLARRHLTTAQKRELIATLLKIDPEASNRQIASSAKVDDKTVGVIRKKMEATAEIPQLTRTIGADGKSRPIGNPSVQLQERTVQPATVPKRPVTLDEDDEDEEEVRPPESTPEHWVDEIGWQIDDAKDALSADDFDVLWHSLVSKVNEWMPPGYPSFRPQDWLEEGDREAVTKWLASSLTARDDLEEVLNGIRAIREEEERYAIASERWRLLDDALMAAAAEAHPGWSPAKYADSSVRAGGYYWKVDEGAPRYDDLISWFRETHPAQAVAIEAQTHTA